MFSLVHLASSLDKLLVPLAAEQTRLAIFRYRFADNNVEAVFAR